MTKICCFSGTGNTLWSAKKIKEIIGIECELLNIGSVVQKETVIVEAEAVVLIFPSYGYGLPLAVRRFIKKTVFKTGYIAAFTTYGSNPGGTLAAARRLLKKKNIKSAFFGRIPAVENYIPLFGPPNEEKIKKRLVLQQNKTIEAARSITERKKNRINTFRPFSVIVWLLFMLGRSIFYKRYRVNKSCNGCGICEKVCPVTAITIKNNLPVFSSKCEHCQGCFNWCPNNAITFGRLKSETKRYHHPDIDLADMAY